MIDIRRILCPIDFSEYSQRALHHAVALARWYESAITVLHVYSAAPVAAYAPGPPGLDTIVMTAADREQLLAEMRRFVEKEAVEGVTMDVAIRSGQAAREIVSQASDMHADLLVMGTHGRSGFDRLLLGSITEKVLRKASCPVLTVPRPHLDAEPAAPVLFKRLLCPVDFSDTSVRALSSALSLAQEADGHLTVLHVMGGDLEDTPDMYDTMISDEPLSVADYRRKRDESACQRLKDVIPEGAEAYCTIETMMARGKPHREILRVAAERASDVIVMGVQGRGVADLLFFGSTANHVVREAACPVLTLRPA